MKKEIIDFINKNEELINQDRWSTLYNIADRDLYYSELIGELTTVFHEANIYPEDSVIKIPDHFLTRTSIQEFTVPLNIEEIGDFAFNKCNNLRSIVFPERIRDIGMYAFCNCDSLTSIKFHDSPVRIRQCAFAGCTHLDTIIIPVTTQYIEHGAFSNCKMIDIVYEGTISQWRKICHEDFAHETSFVTIHCTDGDIL